MKKILSVFLTVLAVIFVFSACNNAQEETTTTVNDDSVITTFKSGTFTIGKNNEFTALLPDYSFTSPPQVYWYEEEEAENRCDVYVACSFSDFTSFLNLIKESGFTNNSATVEDNTFYYGENSDGYFVDMSYSRQVGEAVIIIGKVG